MIVVLFTSYDYRSIGSRVTLVKNPVISHERVEDVRDCAYDKRYISVFSCRTDISQLLYQVLIATIKHGLV
jgi:hypothetical protein